MGCHCLCMWVREWVRVSISFHSYSHICSLLYGSLSFPANVLCARCVLQMLFTYVICRHFKRTEKKKVEKTTTPTITTAATTRQRHNTTNCDIFDKGTCSPMNFDMSQCAIRFINTNDINDTAYASQISLATMVLIEFYATTKGWTRNRWLCLTYTNEWFSLLHFYLVWIGSNI